MLIDPFLTGNPAFEGEQRAAAEGVTHVLLTHGHGDHVGDTLAIAKETGAKVVSNYDLLMWLAKQGLQNFEPMNTGGTVDAGGFRVTLVRADHSAGMVEADVGFPLGSANGIIVKAPGEPTVYHMGDTDIFGDMALIDEIHRPRSASSPSATASPWARRSPRSPASASSTSTPSSPATTPPSPAGPQRRRLRGGDERQRDEGGGAEEGGEGGGVMGGLLYRPHRTRTWQT